MKITDYTCFPHPVLYESNEINDYKIGKLDSEISVQYGGRDEVKVNYKIEIKQDYLLSLLEKDDLKCGLLIESKETFYKKLHQINVNVEDDVVFVEGDLWGKVTFTPIVFANRDINNFSTNDLHDDYNDVEIDIEKGSILAVGNEHEDVLQDEYDVDSLIECRINEKLEEGELHYDIFASGYIVIDVNEKDFRELERIKKDQKVGVVYLTHSLAIPAIMYALSHVQLANQGGNDFANDQDHPLWFSQFSEILTDQGININDSEIDIFTTAQDLLKSGKDRIYNNFNQIDYSLGDD